MIQLIFKLYENIIIGKLEEYTLKSEEKLSLGEGLMDNYYLVKFLFTLLFQIYYNMLVL